MRDWRKVLLKHDLQHLVEVMAPRGDVPKQVKLIREGQRVLQHLSALPNQEVCYDCRSIARKLGLED